MRFEVTIQGYADETVPGFLERADGERLYTGQESALGYIEANDKRSYWKAHRRPPSSHWHFSFDKAIRSVLPDFEGVDYIRALDNIQDVIFRNVTKGAGAQCSGTV